MPEPNENAAAVLQPLKILIVEDDEDARLGLADILELHDHRVQSLGAATPALEMGSRLAEFDVVLMDRKLPEGYVEDLLPRFREFAPRAEFIVVTGYADLDASLSALRQGVADYLIKPINPDALLATLKRMARQRHVEQALNSEREFAAKILETAEAIILVTDFNGRIIRCNRYLRDLTGYSDQEMQDRDWFDVFVPESQRQQVRSAFADTLNNHVTRGVVNPIVTHSGELREVRWSLSAFRDEANSVSGVLAVGLDITDMIAAQRSALQSQRLATIGETMAGLAHESRNALQRLQNAVELLEDDLEGNDSAMGYVKRIGRAGNHLRDLLEEVRNYAAPIQLDRTKTRFQQIWRRAWESLEARHPNHRGVLIETISEDGDPVLSIDQRRMEQVFRNLFENSFDACGPEVEVSITADAHDGELFLSIRDNGPGLDLGSSGKAFDAFFTTKPTGTGLGLSIVQRIIEAHRGSIAVSGNTDGAEFVIRVPLAT